jgi:hypothetical protein
MMRTTRIEKYSFIRRIRFIRDIRVHSFFPALSHATKAIERLFMRGCIWLNYTPVAAVHQSDFEFPFGAVLEV